MKQLIALLVLLVSLSVVTAQDDDNADGIVITPENAATLTEMTTIPLDLGEEATLGTRSVAFSPDGSLVALGTRDGKVVLVDLEAGEMVATLEGLDRDVFDVDFHPDGEVLFAASRGGIMVHDLTAEGDDATQILDFVVVAIEPNPAGDQLAILLDFNANLFVAPFDVETRTVGVDDLTWTSRMESGAVQVAYSADGSRIATVGVNLSSINHIINVFDAETGDLLTTIDPEDSSGGGVALNEDGSIVYATAALGNNPYVGAWDTETGDELFLHTGVDGFSAALANGVLFVGGNNGDLRLYDATDGTELLNHEVAYSDGTVSFTQIYSIAVSPDSTQVALAQGQENELVILGVEE